MVHPDLMRGDGWIRCCICGEEHTPDGENKWPTLWADENGQKWDMCVQCGNDEHRAQTKNEGT